MRRFGRAGATGIARNLLSERVARIQASRYHEHDELRRLMQWIWYECPTCESDSMSPTPGRCAECRRPLMVRLHPVLTICGVIVAVILGYLVSLPFS